MFFLPESSDYTASFKLIELLARTNHVLPIHPNQI